jgi:hypothetical protein
MRARLLPLIALLATSVAHAEPFGCPAALTTDETPDGTEVSYMFRYVSFFDGDPKDLADLAPDGGPDPKKLEQRWQFTRTKDRPIIMICRYHGTDQTIRKEVPPEIKECRIEGQIDEQGQISGSPTLSCR